MVEINNKIDFEIDLSKINLRKERIRKIWQYCRADHIPLGLYIVDNKIRKIYNEFLNLRRDYENSMQLK